jgi:hypothetical protein
MKALAAGMSGVHLKDDSDTGSLPLSALKDSTS